MTDQKFDPIANMQMMIDQSPDTPQDNPDMSMAPPFVRGMNLKGLLFKRVAVGEFDMEWTVDPHLTHYDGMVQGGIVNVIADTGQSFAYGSTSTEPDSFSTAEFTTRFLRPMKSGDVIDVLSVVINRSKRLGIVETKFINRETGKLCALVTGSWMNVVRDLGPPPPQPSPE